MAITEKELRDIMRLRHNIDWLIANTGGTSSDGWDESFMGKYRVSDKVYDLRNEKDMSLVHKAFLMCRDDEVIKMTPEATRKVVMAEDCELAKIIDDFDEPEDDDFEDFPVDEDEDVDYDMEYDEDYNRYAVGSMDKDTVFPAETTITDLLMQFLTTYGKENN